MYHRLLFVASAATLALATVLFAGKAQASERFAQEVPIEPGLVAVVSEGDFEARSIGSYSVRAYFDPSASPENETMFYAAGLVRARDGAVSSVRLLEVPRRKRPLVMVVVQSAGSGGYLSAAAIWCHCSPMPTPFTSASFATNEQFNVSAP